MMFRFFFTLCIIFASFTALPKGQAFPEILEGEWVQSSQERGVINIVITHTSDEEIEGVMTLTGSAYCKEPIPFKGSGSGNTAIIIGNAKIICGYGGRLKGQVTRVSDRAYTGNFAYTWLGITWAKGTFRLSPK